MAAAKVLSPSATMRVGNRSACNLSSTRQRADRRGSNVAGLKDGGFIVTWASPDDSDYGIFGQRYNSSGAAVGGEFAINNYTLRNQSGPNVSALENGGYVVVWTSNHVSDGTSIDVNARVFDAAGTAISTEITVNTTLPGLQERAGVTSLKDGGFVVVWEAVDGVFAQVFSSTGAKVGHEFRANTLTSGEQIRGSVAGLDDGGFLIAWNTTGGGGGLRAQR